MPNSVPRFRLAHPDDLRDLVAIDDAAGILFVEAGIRIELAPEHPFVLDEVARWRRAIGRDLVHLALDERDRPIGFLVLGTVDDQPYVDQLSVHPGSMRLGLGRGLMQRAFEWSGTAPLWLTTYGHLSWNRAYYERLGFVGVADAASGPGIRGILASQRAVLPFPEERIAMVRRP